MRRWEPANFLSERQHILCQIWIILYGVVFLLKGTILLVINQCPGVIQTLLSVYNFLFLQLLQNRFRFTCKKFCLAQHSCGSPFSHPCFLNSKRIRAYQANTMEKITMKPVQCGKDQYNMMVRNLDSVVESTYTSGPALLFPKCASCINYTLSLSFLVCKLEIIITECWKWHSLEGNIIIITSRNPSIYKNSPTESTSLERTFTSNKKTNTKLLLA